MYEAYLITNRVTGSKYVGMTKLGYRKRFRDHWNEAHSESSEVGRHCSKLHQDMLKYGLESFDTELLEGNISEEEHQDKERYYIQLYQTYYGDNPNNYNMTRGGNGTPGYIFTQEVKDKMSEIGKGRTFSPERNQHLREIMTGREYKQEWKDALSAARLGRFKGEENPFFGKHHTQQTKDIIRNTNSGENVIQLDREGNVIAEFFNLADAGRWVAENVSSAKYTTCATRIREVCVSNNPKCTAYGYHWKLKESSSTN